MLLMALMAALSGLVMGGHHGHVSIKTYRGPSHGHGKGHKFAPWGYYAHVPADDHKHGHH